MKTYFVNQVEDQKAQLTAASIMTERDKKLIDEAIKLAKKPDGWLYINENEADTEEARQELHDIASFAYHRDEYSAGLL